LGFGDLARRLQLCMHTEYTLHGWVRVAKTDEPRQVGERIVVRLADPLGLQVARGVQPPTERLLSHRMRQVVTRRHEDHVAMRSLLVAHRLALLAVHVVLAAQHKEHAHAAPASLGHPQLLAHPDPPVEVAWRRDHAEREE